VDVLRIPTSSSRGAILLVEEVHADFVILLASPISGRFYDVNFALSLLLLVVVCTYYYNDKEIYFTIVQASSLVCFCMVVSLPRRSSNSISSKFYSKF